MAHDRRSAQCLILLVLTGLVLGLPAPARSVEPECIGNERPTALNPRLIGTGTVSGGTAVFPVAPFVWPGTPLVLQADVGDPDGEQLAIEVRYRSGQEPIGAHVITQGFGPAGTRAVSLPSLPTGQHSADIRALDTKGCPSLWLSTFRPDPDWTVVSEQPSLVASLQPTSRQQGGGVFDLTVEGQGFLFGAQVHWNGAARQTISQNATQLVAGTRLVVRIPASDLAQAGSAGVQVVNPIFNAPPGRDRSAAASFTITPPPASPPPPSRPPDVITGLAGDVAQGTRSTARLASVESILRPVLRCRSRPRHCTLARAVLRIQLRDGATGRLSSHETHRALEVQVRISARGRRALVRTFSVRPRVETRIIGSRMPVLLRVRNSTTTSRVNLAPLLRRSFAPGSALEVRVRGPQIIGFYHQVRFIRANVAVVRRDCFLPVSSSAPRGCEGF